MADIRQSLANPSRLAYFQHVPQRRPTLARKFEQFRQSGVILMIGTDSGVPLNFHSDATWRELDTWVNTFGVPAMDAIRAATYWPAVSMKVGRGAAPSPRGNGPTSSRCGVTVYVTSTFFRTWTWS